MAAWGDQLPSHHPSQVGRDDGGMLWRLLGLFSQLVDTPFYAELRTKQQLGYIVGSSITESEGAPPPPPAA